ncbi:MAG: hypothetical protein EAZ30_14080 [Betaproteobacteria bacterium]|nr:MAG: hypothetical protein EAZ30_14080 [Betaproteobacteria bacterium]
MQPNIVSLRNVNAQPWKNGGGVTFPLLCWPTERDWALRISVAQIDRDGPFSVFPQIHRFITTLDGDGIRLGAPLNIELRPGAPVLAWPGEIAPHCTLIGNVTRDLNAMVDSKRAKGWMRDVEGSVGDSSIFDLSEEKMRPSVCGFFTLGRARLIDAGALVELPEATLVWSEQQTGQAGDSKAWRIEGKERLWSFQCSLVAQ